MISRAVSGMPSHRPPSKPTAKTPGSLGDSPSSPPVTGESCTARMRANSAKARVIMAKKRAFTRSEKAPMSPATAAENTIPAPKPARRWP